MSSPQEKLRHALSLIDAGDADGVAVKLRERGIRGRRESSCGCPVAQWLIANELVRPICASNGVCVPGYGEVKPSRAIGDFMNAFDTGAYPELEAA